MSYNVDLIVPSLSLSNDEAWSEILALRERYYDDTAGVSPLFVTFHDDLIKTYPCITMLEDDSTLDDSPWADGPLINNFASQMGVLGLVYDKVDEVLPFIIQKANSLGITVADGQTGEIYRP